MAATERRLLLDLYRRALIEVSGDSCVARALVQRAPTGRVWAVAIGKAAAAMANGASAVLGDRMERALLITKRGHAAGLWPAGWEVIEAGHPLPDADSLRAGHILLQWLATAPADVSWLFLISGGASSLVEVLPATMTLEDLQRMNGWLLASGWPIGRMNALRRSLSRIKGGRLLDHLSDRQVHALFISDVPNDDPAVIGSGLLTATADDDMPVDPQNVPDWLRALLVAAEPTAVRPVVRPQVDTRVVATLDHALQAAAAEAVRRGYPVFCAPHRLDGDALDTGRRIAATLQEGTPGVYVWGGETTVQLPERPGLGGRSQHLALAAAQRLAGSTGIALLAAGTDGSDGPGEAAGACIDGGTVQRGMAEGLDASAALAQADAGRFLAAAGDLLDTGPTGTNVTDLVIGVKL